MTFEVRWPDLVTAGGQVKDVGGTVEMLQDFVGTHVRISGGSGFFDNLEPEIDRIRTTLVQDYGTRTKPVFDRAGQGLIDTGHDYEHVDAGVRAKFDRLLPGGHEHDRPYGMSPGDETAGVDRAEFRTILAAPGSAYEDWEQWSRIRDGVDYILGWQWIFDALGMIGFPNLGDLVERNLQGDWDALGRAVSALGSISTYWSKARDELAASLHELDTTWSGNAANATFAWFSEFDNVLFEHSTSIRGVKQRIWGYAMGLRLVIDSLVSIVDSLASLLIGFAAPDGYLLSIPELLLALATDVGTKVLSRISQGISLFLAFFDLVMALGGLMSMAFSQLAGHGDISFPRSIPPYQSPDVDGP